MYLRVDEKGDVTHYPYSATDLILSMPETSWPARPLTDEELAAFGVLPVADTEPPAYNIASQIVVETAPILVDKVWTRQWSVVDLLPEEAAALAPSESMITEERDRRINDGIDFMGHRFQTDNDSRENINGASTFAVAAIMGGAKAGDTRWNKGGEEFTWLTVDNTKVPMDAFTMLEFGKTVANYKANLIYKCRQIKDMTPIPLDYQSDAYWT